MATLLIIIIYIAFISIGIPDSLFGAAWPAIYRDLQAPLASANFVTLIVSGGTLISSLFSARIINKLGTQKVIAISTLMTAFALLGYSFSGNILLLCLFAIPLGLGAGAIDTALNSYVALHYKASTWGSTFLVESKGLPVETAAQITALYYFGMTLGRFLSGVISSKLTVF